MCRYLLRFILFLLFYSVVRGEDYTLGLIRTSLGTDNFLPLVAQIAFEDIQSQVKSIQINYTIKVANDLGTATEAYREILAVNPVGLVGLPFSSQSTFVAYAGGLYRTVMISPSSTSPLLSNKAVYPYFARTVPSDIAQSAALAELVTYFKWKDVAIISSTDAYGLGLSAGFQTRAIQLGINILSVSFLSPAASFTNDEEKKNDIRSKIETTRATGVRIVCTFMLEEDFKSLMLVASEIDFTGPPYVFLGGDGLFSSTISEEDGKVSPVLEKAVKGMLVTSPRTLDPTNPKVETFTKKLVALGGIAQAYSYYAYDSIFCFVYALDAIAKDGITQPTTQALNSDPFNNATATALYKAILSLSFKGLTGNVQFDANGDRLNGQYSVVNAILENNTNFKEVAIVSPGKSIELTNAIIWPDGTAKVPDSTPRGPVDYFSCTDNKKGTDPRGVIVYDDLTDDPNYIGQDFYCDGVIDCNNWNDEPYDCSPSIRIAYIVIGIFVGIFLLFVLFGLLSIILKRKAKRIRAANILFLYIISIASLMGLVSIFFWFGKAQTYKCIIRYWLVFPAVALFIGALSIKQYRVYRVFANKTYIPVVVSNKQLLLLLLLLMAPVLLVLVLWTALDTPEATINTDDGEHSECLSDYQYVFIIILIVYQATLAFISSIFAFITRKYPSQYSESKLISFALYNITIIMCAMIPIIFAINEERFTVLVIILCAIAFFFISSYVILMAPKLFGVYIVDKRKTVGDSRTPNPSGTVSIGNFSQNKSLA